MSHSESHAAKPLNAPENIERLWREFLEHRFPRSSGTKDMTVDLALVDGTVAGCVFVFVQNGTPNQERIETLRNCLGALLDLRARCTRQDAAQKAYIAQLLALSKRVLEFTKQ